MKILITGLGSIGMRHARLLREHPQQFDLLAYRSEDSKLGNPLDINEYTKLESALEERPDIAFITNPTHTHISTAQLCAEAGCHLFIEKPLSDTIEGINTLIKEVDERNLITLMGCQLRFDPVLNQAKAIVESGDLGSPLSFRSSAGSYLPDWRSNQDYRNSYSANPEQGGGVVLDLIHEIDYLNWFFGPPSRVSSEIGYTKMLDIDSEAIAEVVMRTQEDVLGSIHLDYCRRQPSRIFEAVCEQGTVTANLEDFELAIERSKATDTESFNYDRDKRFKSQLSYFINHVQNNEKCENDIKEGKMVLETALEIKKESTDD